MVTLNVNIVKESEKAVNAEVFFYIDGQTYTWKMWFPKSRVKIEGNKMEVEDWLLKKFEQELQNSSNTRVSTAAKIGSINYEF